MESWIIKVFFSLSFRFSSFPLLPLHIYRGLALLFSLGSDGRTNKAPLGSAAGDGFRLRLFLNISKYYKQMSCTPATYPREPFYWCFVLYPCYLPRKPFYWCLCHGQRCFFYRGTPAYTPSRCGVVRLEVEPLRSVACWMQRPLVQTCTRSVIALAIEDW